jgi:hypothetical protein
MEIKQELSHHSICQCKNSIKLRILEYINNIQAPIVIQNIIQKMFVILKNENNQIEIDDNFLKTYIRSIISEMIDNKLIGLYTFENKEELLKEQFYFLKVNTEISENLTKIENKKNNIIFNNNDTLNNTLPNTSIIDIKSCDNSIIIQDPLNELEDSSNSKPDIKLDLSIVNDDKLRNKLMDELISLRKKFDKIKKENPAKKLHEEIHKFNEIKDIGQELLGYIASQKGKKIKDLYDDLNISDDDK